MKPERMPSLIHLAQIDECGRRIAPFQKLCGVGGRLFCPQIEAVEGRGWFVGRGLRQRRHAALRCDDDQR